MNAIRDWLNQLVCRETVDNLKHRQFVTLLCSFVCGCVQELAEEDGDTETVSALTQELLELEEKAEQLDKQRSKGLSAIRSAT